MLILRGTLALGLALWLIPSVRAASDPTDTPKGLRVVLVDVGQGDATIVVGPTGKTLVIDGGNNGRGSQVLAALRRLGAARVDYMVSSHYHIDHMGGLDEVMNGISVTSVWDRGTRDQPSNSSYRDYVRVAGSRRRTVSLGQVFDLGGGCRARVLAYDGNVYTRSPLPIRNTMQQENAASVVLRLDYGDFSMWLGGDLTGGGNGTYDCETTVSQVCGDVDVYRGDHHGSATSTSSGLVANLNPEVAVFSMGVNNPYGHPHVEPLNRLNARSASRALFTTSGGTGKSGFTELGEMTLHTDGRRYRVVGTKGLPRDFYVDEVVGPWPGVGDIVITEIHRAPSTSLGEYLEMENRSGGPLNLNGMTVSGNLGSFTFAASYRLLPGARLVVLNTGIPAKNGGVIGGHCWPFKAITIGNTYDTLRLVRGGTLETVSYSSGFAGGSARAAERVDVRKAATASNFRAATSRYASDWGTPESKNSVDATVWPLMAGVEAVPASTLGGPSLQLYQSGFSHGFQLAIAALSLGNSPGIRVGAVRIPLNPDPLFMASLTLPSFVAFLPPGGQRGICLPLPPGLLGDVRGYFGHFILDPVGPILVPAASDAATFLFPK